LLSVQVTDPANLATTAAYDYRVLQPALITDPNGNQTSFSFTPLGLLAAKAVKGKPNNTEGDRSRASLQLAYSFATQPVFVHTTRYCHHDTETDVPLPERDRTIETFEYSDGFGRLLQTRTRAEDVIFGDANFGNAGLPADPTQPVGDAIGRQIAPGDPPNVVVSGWQVYNNKGWVVEKYEPFFSIGWSYAPPSDPEKGQKVVMFYDPRGLVIRTLNPDASEQRVIYGVPGSIAKADPTSPDIFEPTPWEVYTYDANDNAGRTHPAESTAYRNHWNTPSSVEVDALGRKIISVERNGSNPAADWFTTRTTYDIRGNPLTVEDSLSRVAFAYTYDLTNRAWRSESLDVGSRLMVIDAAGNEVERRDSKGALILSVYDELNRPIRFWARDGANELVTLRGRLLYGDGADAGLTNPENANLLGKLYKHYDEAGLLTFESYDFKGNVLQKTRRCISDAVLLAVFNPPPPNWLMQPYRADWQPPPGITFDAFADTLLDPLTAAYRTSSTYDAVSRMKATLYPTDVTGARKQLTPQYNSAGALEHVELDGAVYVDRIAYNAKGQRLLISYGNGLMTRYTHDPQTFRLLRLRSERYTTPAGLTYHPGGQPLQDLTYVYDLVGNILGIVDWTPGCGVLNNPQSGGVTDPKLKQLLAAGDALLRNFTYDPLYRLLSATGRECKDIPRPRTWSDDQRCGFNSGNQGTPNQDNAPNLTAIYSEAYVYDPAGNMISLTHRYDGNSWTRQFGMGGFTPQQWQQQWSAHLNGTSLWASAPGNQLTHVDDNAPITPQSHFFDANGNLISETTSRHFEWDESDRMRVFRTQPANAEPSLYAQYLYDSAGQRVKKVIRYQGSDSQATVYIDGVFEHARWNDAGQPRQNNHLDIMDDKNRIALVRVGDVRSDDKAPAVQFHFGDHLGSSSVVVDGAGVWINREEYFPYGETSFGSFARKRYRFTGKERDEESGLYYHGARYYAPWLARWTSTDASRSTTGLNLYAAFLNDPIGHVDPTGNQDADVNGTPDAPMDTPPVGSDNIVPDEVAGFTGGPLNCSDWHLPETPPRSLKYLLGVAYGTFQTLAQGGFLLPSPAPESREFEMGRAAGQTATGVAMMAAGTAGEGIGIGADVTGLGAIAGVPVGVGSAAAIAQGAVGVAAGAQTLSYAMSLPDDSPPPGSSEVSKPPNGRTEVDPKYTTIQEASGKGNHYLQVVQFDQNGNIIYEFFVTSGPGGLQGHTEYKALSRMSLKPGDRVLFIGEHAPDNLPGGCHQLMDRTARETGADIAYFQAGETRGSARFYQGGVGWIPR
jgi:RHS repeat-associated protein